MKNCRHRFLQDAAPGEHRCAGCGMRRFTSYGALRPPGLPEPRVRPEVAAEKADRRASLVIALGLYRNRNRWGRSREEFRAAYPRLAGVTPPSLPAGLSFDEALMTFRAEIEAP
ncbi:hypothetical protein BLA24_24600 [Streptomyces cinnamoneus]|uniref:Uncharacterized protein n=1 Tax=Streptomyces cinnamoneus TaxID=53446 RepID=A0A2G1XDH0_STRCJ|nr:DUF6255 family natural product biosynthesis protein [Streptomyces cinnamoneus]PHQ49245.1 hypothetical protein BLA24_24600 [Streptomyces cinnamoneus]PPT15103.1 hypothetical protein CYQ11_21470 [Streptomyces cinnamoneus]